MEIKEEFLDEMKKKKNRLKNIIRIPIINRIVCYQYNSD
jgi:hypothetical protein